MEVSRVFPEPPQAALMSRISIVNKNTEYLNVLVLTAKSPLAYIVFKGMLIASADTINTKCYHKQLDFWDKLSQYSFY